MCRTKAIYDFREAYSIKISYLPITSSLLSQAIFLSIVSEGDFSTECLKTKAKLKQPIRRRENTQGSHGELEMNIKPKARETASDGFHLIGREDGARSLIQHKVTKAKSLQS